MTQNLLLAYRVAVPAFQAGKDHRRCNGQASQEAEGEVNAVNHLHRHRGAPLGTKKAVVRPAVATPKLIDICCMVLAIELALLVCSSVMSA